MRNFTFELNESFHDHTSLSLDTPVREMMRPISLVSIRPITTTTMTDFKPKQSD